MNRTGWRYATAGLFIACIAAVISYNDGLFVARLAGNHDHQAYLYPLLPDGLIVVCLLALVEGARSKPPERSGWATAGLVLGIGLTLAMNAGAGIAHSVLDAVIDGMVPVVFFIAVEVVLWHVRRGRPKATTNRDFLSQGGTVPSSGFEAAKASMAATAAAGNPWSKNALRARFGVTRLEADEIWLPYSPAGEPSTSALATPAGVNGNGNGAHG